VDLRVALSAARCQRHAEPDAVTLLLNARAGLRGHEVAALTWRMALLPNSRVGTIIELPASAAKKGRGRCVPVRRDLKRSLSVPHKSQGRPCSGPVIRSERGGAMTAKSVVNWFRRFYDEAGLQGCSSHSGRRTFITCAARSVQKAGGSLWDVQGSPGTAPSRPPRAYRRPPRRAAPACPTAMTRALRPRDRQGQLKGDAAMTEANVNFIS
jgi:integrase/recombinase XerD